MGGYTMNDGLIDFVKFAREQCDHFGVPYSTPLVEISSLIAEERKIMKMKTSLYGKVTKK